MLCIIYNVNVKLTHLSYESYLNELINKSRVQLVDIVIKAEKFYGVHDMMLDLIYSLRRETPMGMFSLKEHGW